VFERAHSVASTLLRCVLGIVPMRFALPLAWLGVGSVLWLAGPGSPVGGLRGWVGISCWLLLAFASCGGCGVHCFPARVFCILIPRARVIVRYHGYGRMTMTYIA